MVDSKWIIPFKGRNHSGAHDQNFLWRSNNTYIMDNHRAALWCWMQHIDPRENYSLFHIDRHYDTLQSNMPTWLRCFPNDWTMTAQEYLDLTYTFDGDRTNHRYPLFRFDNYLSLYLHKFEHKISACYFATHKHGDKPNYDKMSEVPPWELLDNFEYLLKESKRPWILNVDLDYFFCDSDEDGKQRMLSNEYIDSLFSVLRRAIDDETAAVTTIALSPEWCGAWQASEQVLARASKQLGLDFALPNA